MKRQRFLLVQRGRYVSSHRGGGQKANRCLLEALAAQGHDCRAWALLQGPGADEANHLVADLRRLGLRPARGEAGEVRFWHRGVAVRAETASGSWRQSLAREVESWRPDWALASEDWSLSLLEACAAACRHTIWIDHSPVRLPFGPFLSRERERRLLSCAAGIVTRSEFHRQHLLRTLGLDSLVYHFPVFGNEVPRPCGSPANPYVMMINPSAIKGIDVLLGLARRMRRVAFGAVPSWATTSRDRRLVADEPNVHTVRANDDLDRLFALASVLLVPSRWQEALGQVVIDAMLRGVPVIASAVGGLPEAKLGVDYTVPVSPVERYRDELDEAGVPVPVLPALDLEPWIGPLEELTGSVSRYRELADASRAAAVQYWQALSLGPFYRFLEEAEAGLSARRR